jgi:tetratricopeptide (TPR) repeat protein
LAVFRYKAFVSYSWSDAKWGNWLHHAIETYRAPKALVGNDGRHGPVPARLHPVFKDREEEAAGASIGNAVEEALANSEFLIVVCSPNSAKSQWVNREIAWFKTHRDPANILALIVGGEPGATHMPGREDEECFPKALTHLVNADMKVTDEAQHAPLAADARDTGDGKRGAKLKIAAALLGVGLDELVRRDDRRRARLRIAATATSVSIAAVMSVLAWSATVARDEAVFQRNESQQLTEFMLTDLRGRLDEVGRLDILETVGTRLMTSYDRQNLARLDADALGRRARVQLLLGEIENSRGNLSGALKTYQAAAATTAELLARDPDEPQRMFDHAQSLYWVGYIAWQRGDLDTAKRQFKGYDMLADGLLAADPAKIEWQLEKSYAQSNLGTVASDRGDLDSASRNFATALTIDRRYYESDPTDSNAIIQYGGTLSWSARVATRRYEFGQAEKLYGEGVDLYTNAFGADRKNYGLLRDLTLITTNHAQSLTDLGLFVRAAGQADRAINMAQSLVRHDRANAKYIEYLGNAYLARAVAISLEGDLAGAERNVRDLMQIIDPAGKPDAEAASWQFDVANRGRLLLADIARKRKADAEARTLYEAVLASTNRRDSSAVGSLNTASQIAAHCGLAELDDAPKHWRAIIEKMNLVKGTPIAETAVCHARALIATGRRTEAVIIMKGLKNGGYARPDFVALNRFGAARWRPP